ncbi:ubiquinone-binding protein [Lysobacteraceae bacterium NML75-0749]|nr:ubiquinone-binding protein [Xanthomonadaceae bacterium NML03-0222]PJK02537.1 ubiquinone-binding protein [Xanthomonadaceae bacterium NML75-0749]PJK03480.1 ubiquinone-binding protein [Xanthomonadaceae bacterium NML91-0268]
MFGTLVERDGRVLCRILCALVFLILAHGGIVADEPGNCSEDVGVANRIERSALVKRPAEAMYALVVDVEAYPRRFGWCQAAQVLEREENRMKARLDIGLAGFKTWFMTENRMQPGEWMDMQLADGPFKSLHGRWEFKALAADACKVSLLLEFEPASSLLGPALKLGMKGLADRMVDDFVRAATTAA